MQELVKNSFPSQLSSFEFDFSYEGKYSEFCFDKTEVKCFEYLQTTNSDVLIQRNSFVGSRCFSDWIKLFPKSQTIEFKDWSFPADCKFTNKTEEIKFEGVEVKNITLTNCYFGWTKTIKKVLLDSWLAQALDKVTLKGIKEPKGKEAVRDMVTEYNNVSGKMNIEVIE